MTTEEAQAFLIKAFGADLVGLTAGPLRWVRRRDKGVPPKLILQQQWSIPGKRLWLDVPVDEESAGGAEPGQG